MNTRGKGLLLALWQDRGLVPSAHTQDILERIAEIPLRPMLFYILVARAMDIGTACALYLSFPVWFVAHEQNLAFIELVTQAHYPPFVIGQVMWICLGMVILAAVRYATKVDQASHNSKEFLLAWSCTLFMFGYLVFYSLYGALTNLLGFVMVFLGVP